MAQTSIQILFVLLVLSLFGLVWATYDPKNYCGLPPYPQIVPDLPRPNSKLRSLKPILTDFYTIMRHGARATLRSTCFANTPESNQLWNDCESSIIGSHMGLQYRNQKKTNSFEDQIDNADDKAIMYTFPIQGLRNKQVLPGTCSLGQLTQLGVMMSYNHGYRIGRYLLKSLPTALQPTIENFHQSSTDSSRTKETAQSFVSGLIDQLPLFPDLSQTMKPFTFTDTATDLWKYSTSRCNGDAYLTEAYGSPAWKKYEVDTWIPLLTKIRTILSQDDIELKDVYDCYMSHHCHHKPTPMGLTAEIIDELTQAISYFWSFPLITYNYQKGSQLLAGSALVRLSQFFLASVQRQQGFTTTAVTPDIYTIGGHDHGPMMTLVAALKLEPFVWPPYASTLNFEFYLIPTTTNNNEPLVATSYIRTIWMDQSIVPPFCKKDALHNEFCPTHVYLAYITSILPTKQMCPEMRDRDWINTVQSIQPEIGTDPMHVDNALVTTMNHLQQHLTTLLSHQDQDGHEDGNNLTNVHIPAHLHRSDDPKILWDSSRF